MIYLTPPPDFQNYIDVVTCFILWQDKFLLLQRQERKKHPKARGPPGGKKDNKETLIQAMQRELQEETGLIVDDLAHIHSTAVRHENFDFIHYEFFCNKFQHNPKPPKISLNKNEHCAYKRVLPSEAITMSLIPDEERFVRRFFGIT